MTLLEVQLEIAGYLKRIAAWSEDSNYSLEAINRELLEYLNVASTDNRDLLKAQLELPDEGEMGVLSSGDGKLRIYWWDTRLDDVMTAYSAIAQYETDDGVKTWVLNDATLRNKEGSIVEQGCYYTSISSVKTRSGDTLYLTISAATVGSPFVPESVRAFTIQDGILVDTKVLKIGEHIYDKVEIEYDQFDGLERRSFHFSDNSEQLYMPELDNFLFTGNYHVFAFDGNNYVFDKNLK